LTYAAFCFVGPFDFAALPTSMSATQQEMLDKLKGLKGADFTEQYHSDQVAAHKDAVELFKRYGDEGENADLKAWACKNAPGLETSSDDGSGFGQVACSVAKPSCKGNNPDEDTEKRRSEEFTKSGCQGPICPYTARLFCKCKSSCAVRQI
jgi:uncharacterized protein DUF4142